MAFNKPRKRRKNSQKAEDKEDFSIKLNTNLDDNIENIKKLLDDPNDLVTRTFSIGHTKYTCAVAYIDGLTNTTLINQMIIRNVQAEVESPETKVSEAGAPLLDRLYNEWLSVGGVKKAYSLDDVSLAILSGNTVILVGGTDQVIIIDTQGGPERAVEEPTTERLIRGPKVGFTENIRTNTVFIRKRIRDANLRFQSYKIGRRSKKTLIVTYIDGIVHPNLISEVNKRLKTIDLDDAAESGFIEQWIEDSFLTPFPQLEHTERPDKVAQALTDGKVAILLEGTPFALIAPITFSNMLHSPEDYYERWLFSTLIRFLRYLAAFIAVFLPALYIALLSYHPGLIPYKLAFFIAASREGVPFTAAVEAFMMEITMELLREAGFRVPQPIGQTIGIVGGIVIGQAAVAAGIVSPIMVIIVAITAISSFSLPAYGLAISFRILRFGFMLAAAIFGLYGIILAYIVVNIHIVNLKSFGVPYSTPFAPSFKGGWKDIVIRAPLTTLGKRPGYMKPKDKKRMNKGGNTS
ncbi:spore germination protein [Scopulibacillus darangshiensis]|uniref:Spore germination protein n=1 Tax=Scopulibacillus darangshiensis TaxID=442528 RepID=A0A4R2NG25_9BACL|nr:spore germination protein [Scopulibacillus darangshiensis]TCP20303.1 spore germination protein [Scopulibacillus darangshiensis]